MKKVLYGLCVVLMASCALKGMENTTPFVVSDGELAISITAYMSIKKSECAAIVGITNTSELIVREPSGNLCINEANGTSILYKNKTCGRVVATACVGNMLLCATPSAIHTMYRQKVDTYCYANKKDIWPRIRCIVPDVENRHYSVMRNGGVGGFVGINIFDVETGGDLWGTKSKCYDNMRFIGGAWHPDGNLFTSCCQSDLKTSYMTFDIRQKRSIGSKRENGRIAARYPLGYSPDCTKKVCSFENKIEVYDVRNQKFPYAEISFHNESLYGRDIICSNNKTFIVHDRIGNDGYALQSYSYSAEEECSHPALAGDCFYNSTNKELVTIASDKNNDKWVLYKHTLTQ